MNVVRYISILLLIGMQAKGYVVGYVRLYNPEMKKSVDIVYDKHVYEDLTDHEMYTLSIDEIKQRLFPTERFFLEAVESIEQSDQAKSTALVCESHGKDVPGSHVFLGYLPSLVANRLRTIKYVDADMARTKLLDERTFTKSFLPLPLTSIIGMILNSGEKAWRRFYDSYDRTMKACEGVTLDTVFDNDKAFLNVCRLADVEMLMHILSLPHSRIIVYCGARHGANIVQYLKERAGYGSMYEYNADPIIDDADDCEGEMNSQHLWPLKYASLEHCAPNTSPESRGMWYRLVGFFSGYCGSWS